MLSVATGRFLGAANIRSTIAVALHSQARGGRASGRSQPVRPRFSLAHLTVIRLSPPQVIEVAARTGYDTVGCV